MTTQEQNWAKEALERRIKLGKEGTRKVIEVIEHMQIVDRPCFTNKESMRFLCIGESERIAITYPNRGDSRAYSVHPHALHQLCERTVPKVPIHYARSLAANEGWERLLLCHSLNKLFDNGPFVKKNVPVKYLHRIVGNELRGFLSIRFNRYLSSRPMLAAFLNACSFMQAAPVDANWTDVHFNLKCYLPLVFEPIPGEFIALGCSWSNSDFGAGRMSVTLSCLRIQRGHHLVLDKALSKVHVGSVIQADGFEDLMISEETMLKEVEAQASAINDTVCNLLGEESIQTALEAIRAAAAEDISWAKLRAGIKTLLRKNELEKLEEMLKQPLEDLPPVGQDVNGNPLPSKWWAASALGMLSEGMPSDRRLEVQAHAGALL